MLYDLPRKSLSNRFARKLNKSSSKGRRKAGRLEQLELRTLMATDVVISEFLASNTAANGLRDSDNTLQDWIELHNTTSSAINLNGWHLTDDADEPTLWTFPAQSIPAGGYLVVFASSKDRRVAGQQLHTNFGLNNGGEYLALVRPDNSIAHAFADEYPDQTTNISYGLGADNVTAGYFLTPTPEQANSAEPIPNISQNIVINEIMYHPTNSLGAEDTGEEYIEIVNRGINPVPLAGWKFDDGVTFTFPARTLAVGEYLVIAADVAKFQAKYPGVTTQLLSTGWGETGGGLSNGGERIRLIDAGGDTVDQVEYSDQGEWARRVRGPVDLGHQGWIWQTAADGTGESLELVARTLSNNYGQNWASSSAADATKGTPGVVNSQNDSDDNAAPLIVDIGRTPIIPRSTDNVTVTARLINEVATGVTGTLHWRLDGAASFTPAPMFDDGAHGDGLAGDGVFGATIGMQQNGRVVEYYIQSSDGVNTRTYPTPSLPSGLQQTNFLYQVDDTYNPNAAWVPGSQPIYRLIMTEAERAELADIGAGGGDQDSNAQMNGTLIKQDGTGLSVRYNVGIRNRGHGSAVGPPNNYHVNIPHDNPLDNSTTVILNVRGPETQVLGHAVVRMAGMPAGDASFAQVRVNGQTTASRYAFVELPDGEFVDKHLSYNPGGNMYKGVRVDGAPGQNQEADFRHEGTDPDAYRDTYFKETNVDEDDWSDLIHMTDVLNNAPDANYFSSVDDVINVDQWLRYLALDSLMGNTESGLNTGAGDDYSMYAGPAGAGKDSRFILLPHDHDSLFSGNANYNIFAPIDGEFGYNGVQGLERFLVHPQILPLYYKAFIDLIGTVFNNATLDPVIDRVIAPVDAGRAASMKSYIAARTAGVLAQIPQAFQISSPLPVVNGFPQTTNGSLVVNGTANVAGTKSVTINGQVAGWNGRTGAWTAGSSQTLIAQNSSWKYYNNLASPSLDGQNWTAPTGYNDSAANNWSTGAGQIGFGDNDETTPIGTPRPTTLYFRNTFNIAAASQITGLTASMIYDDGAIIYINGHEVRRANLPNTGVTYSTTADLNRPFGTSPGQENHRESFALDPQWLVNGTNVIAVEVHNDDVGIQDMGFDLALTATSGASALKPGINRVQVEAWDDFGGTGNVLQSGFIDIWYDDGSVQIAPATISTDTTWTAANGPYRITGVTTVAAGATLTIEPGTTVYLDAEATDGSLVINGRLNAQGTQYSKIRFTRTPSATASGYHDGIQFMQTMQDNVIRHAVIEWGGDSNNQGMIGATDSQLTIENSYLDNNINRRIRTQGSSIIVRNNVFTDVYPGATVPSLDNVSEHIWGGIRSPITQQYMTTGQVLVEGNIFGTSKGHNDAFDVDGGFIGQGHIVPQVINNRFMGGGDDAMDLEGDFYIAGNTLTNFVKDQWNTAEGHSNGMSLGGPGGHVYWVVGNTFKNVERVLTAKQDVFVNFVNNTVIDSIAGTISYNPPYEDPPMPRGLGGLFDSNIFVNTPSPFDTPPPDGPYTVTRNIVPASQVGLGAGNISEDPRLKDPAKLDVTLGPGSPAIGTGANGIDRGAKVSLGASISGEPGVQTAQRTANLTVGGPGILAYVYRVDGTGAWSAERPVSTPIALSGLADGAHFVEVRGKNFAGVLQPESAATRSKTWTISAAPKLLINEVLANNTNVPYFTSFPDRIEIYNPGTAVVSLNGVSLTDDITAPAKWLFPTGTTIAGGGYLTVFADGTDSNLHTNFSLSSSGETVYLYSGNGQTLVDTISFGQQLPNLSIGRVGQDRHWALVTPSFGSANVEVRTGDPKTLTINEWLADTQVRWAGDFVELYNPDPLPVNMGGLYMTDDPISQPRKHQIAPLSFIAGGGYTVFEADENGSAGPDHVRFQLFPNQELLALLDPSLKEIDKLMFFPQTTEVSQGRSTNLSEQFSFYTLPTPGVDNTLTGNANALALMANLRVTEVMYNPPGLPGADTARYEYIELQNIGATPLALGGARLAGGVDFTFPVMTLAPSQYVIVAREIPAFNERYGTGLNVAGSFLGELSNGGEDIIVKPPAPYEAAVLRFNYEDDWQPRTDGQSYSLVSSNTAAPPAAWDGQGNWRSSAVMLGSPGVADPVAGSVATLVFNDTDGDGIQDAGELGVSGVAVSIFHAGSAGVLGGADDSLLTTVTTDLAGVATFTGMRAGSYYIQVAAPVGLGFTQRDIGANDAIDSDVDAGGRSAVFTLAVGQNETSRDAGLINIAPTVAIIPTINQNAAPDPTNLPVPEIRFVFSEPVSGFQINDIILRQPDGTVITFPRVGAALTAIDTRTYSLTGLTSLTNAVGTYEVSIVDNNLPNPIRETATTALPLSGVVTDTWRKATAVVAGRHIFYNQSRFDGNSAAANAADDGAIATDKQALRPGQTATFANYTSYSSGINGIMIDVAGLAGTPTVGDFTFRMGNNNTPSGWAVAPDPAISVRTGTPVAGTSRITLIWPNNAISKTWLQVTLKGGPVTGLSADDVFYFGNAIGEAGDSLTTARVEGVDEILARNNQRPIIDPVPVTNRYDFNRDGAVNANDQIIARNNRTTILNDLKLISTPASLQAGGLNAQALAVSVASADANDSSAKSNISSRAESAKTSLAGQKIAKATSLAPQSLAAQSTSVRRMALAAGDEWTGLEGDLLDSLARSVARRRASK